MHAAECLLTPDDDDVVVLGICTGINDYLPGETQGSFMICTIKNLDSAAFVVNLLLSLQLRLFPSSLLLCFFGGENESKQVDQAVTGR